MSARVKIATTVSIMTFSRTTLSTKGLFATLRMNDTQLNNTAIMLCVPFYAHTYAYVVMPNDIMPRVGAPSTLATVQSECLSDSNTQT